MRTMAALVALMLAGCDGTERGLVNDFRNRHSLAQIGGSMPRAPTPAPRPAQQPADQSRRREDGPAQADEPAFPLPPGADPWWIVRVRDVHSKSRLQTFVPFDIVFDYEDAGSETTRARRITVGSLAINTYGGAYRPGLLYVTGWCHLRQDARTFREDQMSNFMDPTTGEFPPEPRTWLLQRARQG